MLIYILSNALLLRERIAIGRPGAYVALFFAAVLSVSACMPTTWSVMTPTVTVPPSLSIPHARMDSKAIMAHLTPADTIEQVVMQLAGLLDTTPDRIKVRVEPPVTSGACMTCDRPPAEVMESEMMWSRLGEVRQPIPPGSAIWLAVQDVMCLYLYDGEVFKPVSVYVATR